MRYLILLVLVLLGWNGDPIEIAKDEIFNLEFDAKQQTVCVMPSKDDAKKDETNSAGPAKMELTKKGREEVLEAYGRLGKQVEVLQADLASAVLTFDYAVKSGIAVKGSKHEFIKTSTTPFLPCRRKLLT
jgi:hypothetical protein